MKEKEALVDHLMKFGNFNRENISAFVDLYELQKVPRKQFWLKEGEISRYEGFVTKGLLKTYKLEDDGAEHTIYFAVKDWWVINLDSFLNEKPSSTNVYALEDSEILSISKKNKDFAFANIPEIEKLYRIKTQIALVAMEKRIFNRQQSDATTLYLDYLTRYPHIACRLTNIDIASYIGVSPEFVSKIRRKLTKKIV